jgi:hypothetical protein
LVDNILLEDNIDKLDVNFLFFICNKFIHFRRCLTLPEDNKIIVLSKGNSKGLIGSIPLGGH